MRHALAALALIAVTGIASAQSGMAGTPPTSAPKKDVKMIKDDAPKAAVDPAAEVLRNYNGVKKNILASADKMPADDFGSKPKPDVRTFARVVNHVSEAQFHVCGAINNTPADKMKVPAETAPKAEVVAALQASFAECDKAYATLTAANAWDPINLGPVSRTRIGALWGNASHDNEQYATLALYLRLKEIAPPSSEK